MGDADRAAEIAENNRFRAEMKREVNDPTPEEIAERKAYIRANPELFEMIPGMDMTYAEFMALPEETWIDDLDSPEERAMAALTPHESAAEIEQRRVSVILPTDVSSGLDQPAQEFLKRLVSLRPLAEAQRGAAGIGREALRLRGRLSEVPFYAARAAKEGDLYWVRSAASYRGD